MKDRLKVIAESTNVRVYLDDQILFEKIGIVGNWKYVHIVNSVITYESVKKFSQKYFNIFIDDIKEQLESGVDRNNLIINIPKKVKKIKCGNKIIEI